MSETTNISYVDSTFSPWYGCANVSAGCANCFAERWAEKFSAGPAGRKSPVVWGRTSAGGTRRLASEAKWREVERWNKSPWLCDKCGHTHESTHGDVGCCVNCGVRGCFHKRSILVDLCDWLDPDIPAEWLARFLGLIRDTPNLLWYLLTKRPENWRFRISTAHDFIGKPGEEFLCQWLAGNPPPNVRLGVSVEDQKRADERIPALLAIPAAFRWVSFEPLLGPIDLTLGKPPGVPSWWQGQLNPVSGINFAVIGGESMKPRSKARPCNVEWIRSLVRQCDAAGVQVHVKQFGSVPIQWPPRNENYSDGTFLKGRFNHWQGGDPAEWPVDLRKYHEVTV